jgi:predicted RNase H-like HicB family nuclease
MGHPQWVHLTQMNPHRPWKKKFLDVRSGGSIITGEVHMRGQMDFQIEFEQEEDGRWIAEIPELPGVMCYGATKEEAEVLVEALALQVIAEQMKANMTAPKSIRFASA